MAERPDPDTDRRNILPGEHAKPDGTWCPYLAPSNEAGVWVCMKCGNSGGVSTPDTDPNTLADRLDFMAQHPVGGYRNWNDDLRAAADGLRRLDAIDRTWDGYTLQPKDVTDRVERTRLLARGQIAASLSVTPTPDRCPTCGSRSREMAVTGSACDPWTGSPDAWHDSGQP